jgi:hypothetical protein
MTEREQKLLQIINEQDKPEEALLTAMEVICGFLETLESSQEQHPAHLQALA